MAGATPYSLPPEEALAFFLLAEYGHWPYPVPLFDLPADKALRILQLASRNVPHRLGVLAEIRDAIQSLSAALAPAE